MPSNGRTFRPSPGAAWREHARLKEAEKQPLKWARAALSEIAEVLMLAHTDTHVCTILLALLSQPILIHFVLGGARQGPVLRARSGGIIPSYLFFCFFFLCVVVIYLGLGCLLLLVGWLWMICR